MAKKIKDNVVKMDMGNIASDKISPQDLLSIIEEDFETIKPEKLFCLVIDEDGYRYYVSKMTDSEIVMAFEEIKTLIIAQRVCAIED